MKSSKQEPSMRKRKSPRRSTRTPRETSVGRVLPPSEHKRPPVITLMGHVDHGKTTLLDTIHHSQLVSKEHGGITQHIGAYRVNYQDQPMTFIDTPGHAAFARMRARGARVTDLVVLIVAANDGVKPQTREALAHIRAANLPFLVAINKIDLPEANIERVKGQLAEEGVLVTGYGGKTISVEVSAKTGKNIDSLMQQILILAHEKCDLSANPRAAVEAVVIETHHDKRRGPLATLLVKNGTPRVGETLPIDGKTITVRAMTDENGLKVKEATPGTAVEVLGFKTLPPVGWVIGGKGMLVGQPDQVPQAPRPSLTKKESSEEKEQQDEEKKEKQTIKIVLKADSLGSLEAITSNLSEEVDIIGRGVGEVNESDVLLALATGATVYAFGTEVSNSARKLAELEKITVKTYNIIYKLFEDLEKRVLKILEPTIDEEVIGTAVITQEFTIKRKRVAGCKVTEGIVEKSLPIHLKRAEAIVKDARIRTLKQGQQDVDAVKEGSECGMTFKPEIEFRKGDIVISYRKIEESEESR